MTCLSKRISSYIAFLILFILSGCGVGSIYNASYYSETALEERLYRVTFQGGRAPMTGDLCLLRCAEVTLEANNDYFQVVDSESGSSIRSFPSHYPFHRHQVHTDPFVDDLSFVTKTIRLSKVKPTTGFAYEASVVKSSLMRKYNINSKK
ncbi:MAG: hypothetical protein HN548_01955 [Opitutae bacterium]|nr:hypothetical protein [Opitutae bacterium]